MQRFYGGRFGHCSVDWIDWGGLTIVVKLFTIVPQPQTIATIKTLNNGRATMQKKNLRVPVEMPSNYSNRIIIDNACSILYAGFWVMAQVAMAVLESGHDARQV
jgi:hypothetical protein